MIVKKIQRAYLIQSGLRPPRIAPATSDQLTPIAAMKNAAVARYNRDGGQLWRRWKVEGSSDMSDRFG